MNAAAVLDTIGLTLSCLYVVVFVPAFFISASRKASLRNLTVSVNLYRIVLIIAASNTVIQAADISNDGPVWPIIWIFNFGFALLTLRYLKKRREYRSEQIMREVEQMLSESNNLLK